MTSLLCDVFQCNALSTVKSANARMELYSVQGVILNTQQSCEKASVQNTNKVKLD